MASSSVALTRLVFFEPQDVWFFRDARAFAAGTDHKARLVFPPPPTTVHGAVRTFVAWTNTSWRPPEPLPPGYGDPDTRAPIRVIGPYPARRGADGCPPVTTYHPLPADCVVRRSDDGARLARRRRLASPDFVRSRAEQFVLWEPQLGEGESVEKVGKAGPVPFETISAYLLGEQDLALAEDGLWAQENRFGIAIDRSTRTVEEGRLYTAEFLRTTDGGGLAALVQISDASIGDQLPEEGILQLGGESRLAAFRSFDPPDWNKEAVASALEGKARFTVYLATPAPVPPSELLASMSQRWKGLSDLGPRTVAIASAGVERTSSFDLLRGTPRRSLLQTNPGTVVVVETDLPPSSDLVAEIHGETVFVEESEGWWLGLGQVFLGAPPTLVEAGG